LAGLTLGHFRTFDEHALKIEQIVNIACCLSSLRISASARTARSPCTALFGLHRSAEVLASADGPKLQLLRRLLLVQDEGKRQ
jgi:hypothetical protein